MEGIIHCFPPGGYAIRVHLDWLAAFNKNGHLPNLVQLCHEKVMNVVLAGLQDVQIEVRNGQLWSGFRRRCHVPVWIRGPWATWTRQNFEICSLVRLWFVTSKCKAMLQDWKTVVPNLIPSGEEVMIVGRFNYMCNCMSSGFGMVVDVSTCLSKTQDAQTGLRHLCCRADFHQRWKVAFGVPRSAQNISCTWDTWHAFWRCWPIRGFRLPNRWSDWVRNAKVWDLV